MCLIFIALKQHPRYKLIVAGNRDEFYHRKTAAAAHWDDYPEVIGGRDLEAGGTWLGMTTSGKIGMITNYRDPKNINPNAPSRGYLVSDYLTKEVNAGDYTHAVAERAHLYNGFNLLTGTPEDFYYISNYGNGIQYLSEGLFGISNHLLETPWPKVVRGKQRLRSILTRDVIQPEDLFEVLYDESFASDGELPDTGIGLERERALSAMFIKSPGYGTRCSTVIMVDQQNNATFIERVFDLSTFQYTSGEFNFKVEKPKALEER